jgi:hypothetical protein
VLTKKPVKKGISATNSAGNPVPKRVHVLFFAPILTRGGTALTVTKFEE